MGDEKVESYAIHQLTAIERMDHLVRDLLDATRIEAGKLTIDKQTHDVAEVFAQVVEISGPIANRKSLNLEITATGGMPIHCDRDRLYQVLSNLGATPSSSRRQGGTITFRAESTPAEVILTVSDDGPGISEADLPHIFDRYWQASGSKRMGLGLGLAIAKAIVMAHGGRIWAVSEPGEGSTFYVALPRAPEVVRRAHARGEPCAYPQRRRQGRPRAKACPTPAPPTSQLAPASVSARGATRP